MALREYQTEIELDTLYEVRVSGRGVEQIKPSISIIGGAVDVYVSQVEPDTAPTGMSIIENGAALGDSAYFHFLPNYLYVSQASGTTTSIVLSGISIKAV